MAVFSLLARLFRNPNRLSPRDYAARRRASDVVLDVRTPEEYARGHVAGALNVDVRAPDFEARLDDLARAGTIGHDTPVYLYCRSGARSGRATRALRARGFTRAFNVGGIGGLDAAGIELRR